MWSLPADGVDEDEADDTVCMIVEQLMSPVIMMLDTDAGLTLVARKNNHPFGIYENIKLGLINYTLLGLIEHHGVFIDSGHYVSYIRQSNKWYHCDDKHITETNLLTLSNNVYLMFYAKEVDLGT